MINSNSVKEIIKSPNSKTQIIRGSKNDSTLKFEKDMKAFDER